jgi:hypothetical protein
MRSVETEYWNVFPETEFWNDIFPETKRKNFGNGTKKHLQSRETKPNETKYLRNGTNRKEKIATFRKPCKSVKYPFLINKMDTPFFLVGQEPWKYKSFSLV